LDTNEIWFAFGQKTVCGQIIPAGPKMFTKEWPKRIAQAGPVRRAINGRMLCSNKRGGGNPFKRGKRRRRLAKHVRMVLWGSRYQTAEVKKKSVSARPTRSLSRWDGPWPGREQEVADLQTKTGTTQTFSLVRCEQRGIGGQRDGQGETARCFMHMGCRQIKKAKDTRTNRYIGRNKWQSRQATENAGEKLRQVEPKPQHDARSRGGVGPLARALTMEYAVRAHFYCGDAPLRAVEAFGGPRCIKASAGLGKMCAHAQEHQGRPDLGGVGSRRKPAREAKLGVPQKKRKKS